DNTSEIFQHDGSGNLVEHTDGEGKMTHFIYDSDDRMEEVRVPNGDSVKYTYDINGNTISRGDHFADESRNDTITEYEYDSNDRLSGLKCVDSTGKVLYRHKFAYDITNLTTGFSDIFGTKYNSGKKYGSPNIIGESQGEEYDHIYKFSEDEYGVKPLKYGAGNIGVKYAEDFLGEPADIPPDQGGNIEGRLKYGMGEKKSEFTYDNLSRLTEYTDFFGNKYYYGYDRYSRLALVKYPNEILTGYAYDEAGRLDSITHKRESGDVLRSCGYQYDANGNITRVTSEDYSYIDYEYDDWNRLTRETWKNAVGFTTLDIQYSYNNPVGDTGNIYQKIVSRNGGSPETTTFNYDAYNKLTSITHPDSTTETLNYDSNGQLTKRQKSTGETTQYEWNDLGFLMEDGKLFATLS
ncbi:MAG: hypothetical protein K8T10_04930, partial [Candidatus Eremiobacteraeota bacterium]|nr:hypothetical protein [Candidatus Eremiobacteraeota bacterium]